MASNIRVFKSQIPWSPFLRTVITTANFKRFCIGDDAEYMKYLRTQVVRNEGGWFFYAEDARGFSRYLDTNNHRSRSLLGLTVASVRNGVLCFHVYWSHSYRDQDLLHIADIAYAVCSHFKKLNVQNVVFPLPSQLTGLAGDNAVRQSDEHQRELVWYKFSLRNFVDFTQSTLRERIAAKAA